MSSGESGGAPADGVHAGSVVAFVLALLELACATLTAYICAGTLAYGGWIIPGIIGLGLTTLLFAGAVGVASIALASRPKQRLAIAALVLSVLAFGGFYPGCKKGLHDSRCPNDDYPKNAECAGFW